MKKILVAGGTGFIGSHLIKKCVTKGWTIYCLSLKKIPQKKKIKKVNYLTIDINNKKKLKKLKKLKINIVVNLSGGVNHRLKKNVMNSHYYGVINLIDSLDKKFLKLFIQIGSSAEYGKLEKIQKENIIGVPESYYGKAKLLSSNYLLNNNKFENFSKCVLRLYQVYGPEQKDNRVIAYVIKNSIQNKKFYCSTGSQIRDFIYISDVIDAIFKTISNVRKVDGQIINIGFGKGYKLLDVITSILKLTGKGKPIFGTKKMRKDEAQKVVSNISKAKKLINWIPKISLKNGLKLTINSFLNEK